MVGTEERGTGESGHLGSFPSVVLYLRLQASPQRHFLVQLLTCVSSRGNSLTHSVPQKTRQYRGHLPGEQQLCYTIDPSAESLGIG